MDDDVIFQRMGSLGRITLNRPKALNALTREMCVVIRLQLQIWADAKDVEAVVIDGAGDRAFCAGGDVVAMRKAGLAGEPAYEEFFADEYRLNSLIHHFPKPYIALIDGIVMGGGVGLSVHGSHRIATEATMFAMPETGLGLIPDVGGTYFMPRLPGESGMYLALTGARLKAADCLHLGVANSFVPAQDLGKLIETLAGAHLPNGAAVDTIIGQFSGDAGAADYPAISNEVDQFLAGTDVSAIIENLATGSAWAKQQSALLETKSPLSLALTMRAMKSGASMSFNECMRQEFRIVSAIKSAKDFYEGVRAILIDKDKSPKWDPASLDELTDADLDRFFETPHWGDLVFGG
ncbi:MAG: enoyl-CoA hydratase/isomerase family protein [Pseudomonadota bacterium]